MRKAFARLGWLAVALQLMACTVGVVTKDGSPVPGSLVEIKTCDSVAGTYVTTTDGGGGFKFNPFDADSEAFDTSRYIATGPIALVVAGDDGSMVTRHDHQYDHTCPTQSGGSIENLPCKFYGVDLEPMSFPEFSAELLAFYEDDCGQIPGVASILGTQALDSVLPTASFDLTSGRGSQVSCITQCTFSCSGQQPADFQPCMCLCVESNCGAQFGPFCTEAAP